MMLILFQNAPIKVSVIVRLENAYVSQTTTELHAKEQYVPMIAISLASASLRNNLPSRQVEYIVPLGMLRKNLAAFVIWVVEGPTALYVSRSSAL